MKKLLNTLYITTPDSYLSLEGETVQILRDEVSAARLPLHNLESIVAFGRTGASPALMNACAKQNISLCFLSPNGRFLARIVGESRGNVTLRREQYRIADSEDRSCAVAKSFIIGKIYNARWVVERVCRDHGLRVDAERLKNVSFMLNGYLDEVRQCKALEELRGIEGCAASAYFSVFDEMILQQKDAFIFDGRNRRPPTDNVNALLSFIYTMLANDCAAALEASGLDAYVGFMHRDRPGRASLALDLMEELRGIMADRFVLTLINKRIIEASGFSRQENGAVRMDDDTRKAVLTAWQERKRDEITHPFLEEKMEWGLVPHVQAMLLARYIRGDLDAYPPFLWK